MGSTKELIAQLKEVRIKKGISYQNIVDMTMEIGKPVSLSTVKRVFGADSENYDFRYESTLQPIVSVLLGIGEETEAPKEDDRTQIEQYYVTVEALKSVVEVKNGLIQKYSEDLEHSKAEIERRNRIERTLYVLLATLVAIILILVAVDLSLSGVGWFRIGISLPPSILFLFFLIAVIIVTVIFYSLKKRKR